MAMAAIDTGKLDELRKRAQRDVDEGVLPSCQLALAKDGELVLQETYGDADDDTRYVVFSATKPFVAGAAWVLIGDGVLDPARPVIDYLPEFMVDGEPERRSRATVEMVMLHTSGFPMAPLGPPAWDTREGRLDAFARWRFNWEPGTAFEYHPTSAHWVLAEVIERVAGKDYRDVLEERVTAPIGLRRVLGIPAGDQAGIAVLEERGEPPSPEEMKRVLGIEALPVTEVTNEALLQFNRPDVRAVGVPGGGAIMRAADLALYYQALLHDRAGVWDPKVLSDATSNVRNTFPDALFQVPANRTLGLVVAGDDGLAHLRSNFGRTVSPGAFGHAGAAGQIAWADPATGLSFGYCTNGIDTNVLREYRRGVALSSIAGAC